MNALPAKHLLVIMRLGKEKAQDKLLPMMQCEVVGKITLVRHAKVAIQSSKLNQVIHEVGVDDSGPPKSLRASIRNLVACFINGLRVLRRENPDAIVAFNLFPYGLIAWMIARLGRKPVLLSLIGTDYNKRLNTPILGSLLKNILRASARVFIFGHQARQNLISIGIRPERVFVLPNTVDTTIFYPDPSINTDIDLIYVGNLHGFKRVDTILRALQEIQHTRPETTLHVIGDGSERISLGKLARTLGIDHAVSFVGWSDNIPELLRRSRILLLLSEHEGLPAAMLEAMCTGLPVIVTKVGGIPSVVHDGKNGYLLAVPTDPHDVAEKALRLLKDDEHYQQMRQQALEVRSTHGYENAARVWGEALAWLD